MNRLNFIKIIALTAISSTIFSNSINALSCKTDLIIPNVCRNRIFDIDFDKHNVVIEGINKTYVNWNGCIFNLKNMPKGSSLNDMIYGTFTEGSITYCRFDYDDAIVRYDIIDTNGIKRFSNK